MSIIDSVDLDTLQIRNIVNQYLHNFEQLAPTEEKNKIYKAIVIIFPNIPLSSANVLIDGVQKELKASFVKKGMMIGEFHNLNNSSGLRNPHFYPLRTPYPCIALRYMVATDIAFMTPTDSDSNTKSEYLKGYIRNFGTNENWKK